MRPTTAVTTRRPDSGLAGNTFSHVRPESGVASSG